MSSQKQTEANQANALLGGIKTEEGKAVSRMNALKYGFFSKIVTEYDKLSQEDLCQDIYSCFDPQTAYEEQLVEILLSNLLAYRRISFVEHELIKKRLDPRVVRDFFLEAAESSNKTVEKEGYRPVIDGNVIEELEKFQRYKTATVNLILKTQHELERLSRLRRGDSVPAPLAVDVTVGTN